VGASSILMCRLPAMDMRTLFHPTCSASNKEARKAEWIPTGLGIRLHRQPEHGNT
jgi:hypothetical protein